MNGPEEVMKKKKKKRQRSKSHYLIISSLKKKNPKYLVFNLIFFLDYCCMKGLDEQQNQEKLKSHQSGMVAANVE